MTIKGYSISPKSTGQEPHHQMQSFSPFPFAFCRTRGSSTNLELNPTGLLALVVSWIIGPCLLGSLLEGDTICYHGDTSGYFKGKSAKLFLFSKSTYHEEVGIFTSVLKTRNLPQEVIVSQAHKHVYNSHLCVMDPYKHIEITNLLIIHETYQVGDMNFVLFLFTYSSFLYSHRNTHWASPFFFYSFPFSIHFPVWLAWQ